MPDLGSATFQVRLDGIAEIQKGFDEMGKSIDRLIKWEERLNYQADTFVRKAIEKTQSLKLLRQALEEDAAATLTMTLNTQDMSMASARALGRFEIAIDSLSHGFARMERLVPSLVASLGGSGALLLGVTGLAAAAHALYTNWDELTQMFSSSTKPLPQLKDSLEGLKEALSKIGEEIKKLKEAAGEPGENKLFGIDFGDWKGNAPLGLKDATRLQDLQRLQKEGNAREQAMKDVKATGPEHTKETEERAKRVKDAISRRNRGSEGIIEDLIASGLTKVQANEMLSQASRGSFQDMQEMARRSIEFREGQESVQAQKRLEMSKKVSEDIEHKRKEHVEKAEKQGHREGELAKDQFERGKKERIEALQDQEKLIMKRKHQIAEDLWEATHNTRPGKILQSAKAAIDMYQSASGADSAKELAKRAHKLQEEANKKLEKIKDAIEKERRGVFLAK